MEKEYRLIALGLLGFTSWGQVDKDLKVYLDKASELIEMSGKNKRLRSTQAVAIIIMDWEGHQDMAALVDSQTLRINDQQAQIKNLTSYLDNLEKSIIVNVATLENQTNCLKVLNSQLEEHEKEIQSIRSQGRFSRS